MIKWLKASESMLVHPDAIKEDAKYECVKCQRSWIGPRMSGETCECGSIYYKWKNFEELKDNKWKI